MVKRDRKKSKNKKKEGSVSEKVTITRDNFGYLLTENLTGEPSIPGGRYLGWRWSFGQGWQALLAG